MPPDERQNEPSKDGARDAAEEERMIRIMQYCDGVLPPREAALVADEIASDPEAACLAAELATGAAAARDAWGSLASGPVPFEMARQVAQAARNPAVRRRHTQLHWQMAAMLVVGVALGMLGLLLVQHGDDRGLRLAGAEQAGDAADTAWQPALMRALAQDPRAATVPFGDGADGEKAVSIVRWFETATGLRCAEFAQASGGTVTGGGIACRKPDGGWDVIEQEK